MRRIIILIGLLLATPLVAQVSPSYMLRESVLNAGGHPAQGAHLVSAGFRMTLGALGDGVASTPLGGPFRLGPGFVSPYPPPGEVLNLRFSTLNDLQWDPGTAAGTYNLYLGSVTSPFDPAFGNCRAGGIAVTTAVIPENPAPGTALFLLATEENLLSEEGTKGFSSGGAPRPNPAACP